MVRKILIAIDAGEPARSAMTVGAVLARQLGARLIVAHVVDITLAYSPANDVASEPKLTTLRESGRQFLHLAAATLLPMMAVEELLLEGDPAEAIVAAARERCVDLIVIGTDSRGRLAGFLVGSTTDAVIRRAPCPVVTVRHQRITSETGGAAASDGRVYGPHT